MMHPEADLSLQEPIRSVEPAPAPAPPSDVDLHDKSLYFGRELSWLDFNDRVLQLVEDESMPLLERVKLAAIWSSNLDEFFQIRVAGVHDQIDAGLADPGPDGLTPSETIDAIRTGRGRPAAAPGGDGARHAVSGPGGPRPAHPAPRATSPSPSARRSASATGARSSRS